MKDLEVMLALKRSALLLSLFTLIACSESSDDRYHNGEIPFEPDRPDYEDPEAVSPYSGEDPLVLEAQSELPTGMELHRKVIWRTCTPNEGVCHNRKEYPDLRTPASFADTFGAFCNVQPGEPGSVYDGCERPGDRIHLSGFDFDEIEIGWVELIPGETPDYDDLPPLDAPGLHLHLASPIPGDKLQGYSRGDFIRTFVHEDEVKDSVYFSFESRWAVLEDGRHLYAMVRPYQADTVQSLLGSGIIEGDANRNGTFGAQQSDPVKLMAPGEPESSYLIARMRGVMHGEEVPGSRMPLANQPLTVPEMLALFCFVEGFPKGGDETGLAAPIDYKNCSYSDDPASLNLLGEGVTWASRISKILEFNCGGCHSGPDAAAGLDLLSEGVYERLLAPSVQKPELDLITPGDAENSYLYLKLIGDDSIIGTQMPYNPLTGEGSLEQAELDDILTWIVQGAIENE